MVVRSLSASTGVLNDGLLWSTQSGFPSQQSNPLFSVAMISTVSWFQRGAMLTKSTHGVVAIQISHLCIGKVESRLFFVIVCNKFKQVHKPPKSWFENAYFKSYDRKQKFIVLRIFFAPLSVLILMTNVYSF